MNEHEFLSYIENEIQWHDKKAVKLKRHRVLARMLIICFSAAISLLAVIGANFVEIQKEAIITTAIFAHITTILESAIQINQYELWVQYRQTCENLKWEKFMYISRISTYADTDQPDKTSLFAEKCGQILSNTKKQWLEASSLIAKHHD